ncbi:hypothetical protein NRB20_50970 [Nocardia sp. RB20]|uniref:Uncharacterized protein n=1 Tax=Nocardia macrotermitis TaxID=2585198 RepID=A0A7K0DAS8_9NOCA|nr:hypothetical protein [Nocardia macrotermitis]
MNEVAERTSNNATSGASTTGEGNQSTTESLARSGSDGRVGYSEHRTEAGQWQAIWMFDQSRIRIVLVHNMSESTDLFRTESPTTAPDLAQMREQYPRLSRLWDAIRHEFWTESLGPGGRPPTRA